MTMYVRGSDARPVGDPSTPARPYRVDIGDLQVALQSTRAKELQRSIARLPPWPTKVGGASLGSPELAPIPQLYFVAIERLHVREPTENEGGSWPNEPRGLRDKMGRFPTRMSSENVKIESYCDAVDLPSVVLGPGVWPSEGRTA